MLEIVFGESAAGSLKIAQSYGKGQYQPSAIGVIVSKSGGEELTPEELDRVTQKARAQERADWEAATPLGGKASDVYSFPLYLSIGDIAGNAIGPARLAALQKLFRFEEQGGNETAKKLLQTAQNSLAEVHRRALCGESVRIWYSDQPDELCGCYWFLAQLREWGVSEKVYSVKLPDWKETAENTVETTSNWGDVGPAKWSNYLDNQRELPSALISAMAAHWRQLQAENAPLRATLNGRLCSMPENLYDSIIRRELAAMEPGFHEAMLIGRVIGKYQLGVCDAWLALRVEHMIDVGELEVVAAAPEDVSAYCKTLRKKQQHDTDK